MENLEYRFSVFWKLGNSTVKIHRKYQKFQKLPKMKKGLKIYRKLKKL